MESKHLILNRLVLVILLSIPIVALSQRTDATERKKKLINPKAVNTVTIPTATTTQTTTTTATTTTATSTFTDIDQDKLDDNFEKRLLERFRPYFFFTNSGSEENFRPTDVLFYLKTSDIHTDGDEDGKYTFIQQSQLASNPYAALFDNGKYGSSDVTKNATISQYRINPNENVPGYSERNPGRHGNSWQEELQRKNIGLYGHVDVVQLPEVANQDFYKVEYWQFFGYNSADKGFDIGDHEGDWTSVQVIYDPRGDSIYATMHYAHGKEFKFDMNKVTQYLPLNMNGGSFLECRGINYSNNIDLVSHDLKFNQNDDDLRRAQSNVLRLFKDDGTGNFSHPVVYIEHGTHEFFPSPAWDFYAAPSHSGDGYNFLTNTPPNLGEVEHPLNEDPAALIILHFNGYWGAYCKANCSPPGPPLHANWGWPASSSVKWLLPPLTY